MATSAAMPTPAAILLLAGRAATRAPKPCGVAAGRAAAAAGVRVGCSATAVSIVSFSGRIWQFGGATGSGSPIASWEAIIGKGRGVLWLEEGGKGRPVRRIRPPPPRLRWHHVKQGQRAPRNE